LSRELVIPHLGPLFVPDPALAELATDTDLAAHVADGDPHAGYATDTDLTNHAADFDAHTLPWVKDHIPLAAGSTISTTEAVEQTLTITIPGTWASYDLEALVEADILVSGTLTGVRTVTTRLRLGATVAGPQIGRADVHLAVSAPNRLRVPVYAPLVGETTTGSISVVYTTEIPADNGQTSYANFVGTLTAWRTS